MPFEAKPKLLVDSREQLPYEFKRFGDQFAAIERRKLLAGDYSIHGFETKVAVERKSLPDLVQTIIRDRQRFKAELAKLMQYDFAAVVIEASLKQVSSPYAFSQANPLSVVGSIQSFSMVYGVHFIFADDRVNAEAQVAGLLLKFWKYNHPETP